MSGQAGLAFLQGGLNGFETVDRIMSRREDRKEGQRRYELGVSKADEERTYQRDRDEQLRAESNARWGAGLGLQHEQLDMKKQDHDAKKRKQRRGADLEKIKYGTASILGGGEPDQDYLNLIQRPEYRHMNPANLVGAGYGKAIETFKSVMDGKNPARINDPDSLEAMNLLLENDVNTDREGNPLQGKRRISRIIPGKTPGTFMAELELEDGTKVPMTARRGTEKDGDNIVLEQNVDAAMQKVMGMAKLRDVLMTPEGRAATAKYANLMGVSPSSPEMINVADGANVGYMKEGEFVLAHSNPKDQTGSGGDARRHMLSVIKAGERTIDGMYGGKFDGMGNMLSPPDNPAKALEAKEVYATLQTENSDVPYLVIVSATKKIVDQRISKDEAIKQAMSEANSEQSFMSKAADYIPFVDNTITKNDPAVQSRADEIYSQSRRGGAGLGSSSAGTQITNTPKPNIPLPPQAAAQLQEGKVTSFKNGQSWTVRDGQPVRVN